jgi:hypothetical protein
MVAKYSKTHLVPKNVLKNAQVVSKNAELDAYFESVEKVAIKFMRKKLASKKEKWSFYFYYCVQKFSSCNFFKDDFLNFFYGLELGIKFCVFLYPYQIFFNCLY